MGVAPSKTLPVLSSEDLAALAEDEGKGDVADIVREHQLDGPFLAEGLDDEEVLNELTPKKVQQRKLKVALQQLQEYLEKREESTPATMVREASATSSATPLEVTERERERERTVDRRHVTEGWTGDGDAPTATLLYDEDGPADSASAYAETFQTCSSCGKPFLQGSRCCAFCTELRPTLAAVQAEFMEDLSNADGELRIFVVPRDVIIDLADARERLPVFQDLFWARYFSERSFVRFGVKFPSSLILSSSERSCNF